MSISQLYGTYTQYAQFHVRIHYYVVTPVMCSLGLVANRNLFTTCNPVDGYTSIASYNKSAPGKVCNIHTTLLKMVC